MHPLHAHHSVHTCQRHIPDTCNAFQQGVQPGSLQMSGGMSSPPFMAQQAPYSQMHPSVMSTPHTGQRMTQHPGIGSSPGAQKLQPPSVLASLLQQNRGNAANALSNRPSPKQAQKEPTAAGEASPPAGTPAGGERQSRNPPNGMTDPAPGT